MVVFLHKGKYGFPVYYHISFTLNSALLWLLPEAKKLKSLYTRSFFQYLAKQTNLSKANGFTYQNEAFNTGDSLFQWPIHSSILRGKKALKLC